MKLSEIRWESVGKIAAGVLLAVAIVVSAPSLLGGDEPQPLPPDVGLPQAAPPPPIPVAPPPRSPKPKSKPKSKPKGAHRPKRGSSTRSPEEEEEEETSSAPTAPIVAALPPPPAPETYEDFGFERP